ncbi:hypothetical protein HSR122_2131 [Halapricum desulfuricans]|uniref:Uncharacterized protein n=1 Tax=Halapricum desulfuricans TaxID=2841257 RepID=A0A897NDI6_9EURY|nr:hypothetical protein HSR122_2131 [Halapricum desulfuricans]
MFVLQPPNVLHGIGRYGAVKVFLEEPMGIQPRYIAMISVHALEVPR